MSLIEVIASLRCLLSQWSVVVVSIIIVVNMAVVVIIVVMMNLVVIVKKRAHLPVSNLSSYHCSSLFLLFITFYQLDQVTTLFTFYPEYIPDHFYILFYVSYFCYIFHFHKILLQEQLYHQRSSPRGQ